MTLIGAIAALDALVVGSVNVVASDAPVRQVYVLPALVLHLHYSQEGFTQLATDDTGQIVLHPEHVLLAGWAGDAMPIYEVAALVDAYLAVLKNNWSLDDELMEPLRIVEMRFGPVDHAGSAYVGCRLRHRWVLAL